MARHQHQLPISAARRAEAFSAAVERLTHRNVVAFRSANQTAPGVACELFLSDAPALMTSGSAT